MIPASVMAIQITTSVLKTNIIALIISYWMIIVMAYSLTSLISCEDKAVNVPAVGYSVFNYHESTILFPSLINHDKF